MKRIFYAASVICSLFAVNANAQYTLDKDTSKGNWGAVGYMVETKIKVTPTGSGDVSLSWSVNSYSDAGGAWKIPSVCEPFGSCYSNTTPGLLSGSTSFNCTVPGGASGYYDISFDGDAAPVNSYAYLVLNVSDGSTSSKPVFIAYKTAAGVSTVMLKDADVNIFPNPASNYIDVIYNPAADVKTITLYNLIGKAVNVYKVTDKSSARCEFPADMPSGIYIVRIADSKGSIIATRKITHQ
ncbi:MAG: T9SS type A sorting domain-containing protein [Chitinophagaceae bacterium]|uniref:Secretion system C-terminal sorting domain-containing protein n=1 Tax=Rurimicrobium arvi TaxID=2049916 RepID=A0ABP8MIU5_9BACT